MSWMDSWSRPSRHAATPPPLYLTAGGKATLYCHICRRVSSSRKAQSGNIAIKYCSDRCWHNKPGPVDRKIEDAFLAPLEGEKVGPANSDADAAKAQRKPSRNLAKRDRKILVQCGTVEKLLFGSRHDPGNVHGRKKNRASRALAANDGGRKSVDMKDTDGSLGNTGDESTGVQVEDRKSTIGPMVRPLQTYSSVNGNIGVEKGWAERKEETAEELDKRKAGQQRAEERGIVAGAARACAFGLKLKDKPETAREETPNYESRRDEFQQANIGNPKASEHMKKCEAVMGSFVVEASFAKGDWAIR